MFLTRCRPFKNAIDNFVEGGQLAVLALISAQLTGMTIPLTFDESLGMGLSCALLRVTNKVSVRFPDVRALCVVGSVHDRQPRSLDEESYEGHW